MKRFPMANNFHRSNFLTISHSRHLSTAATHPPITVRSFRCSSMRLERMRINGLRLEISRPAVGGMQCFLLDLLSFLAWLAVGPHQGAGRLKPWEHHHDGTRQESILVFGGNGLELELCTVLIKRSCQNNFRFLTKQERGNKNID